MPLEIRSIEEREAQIIADVQSETGQLIPPIKEAWDRIWALVIAGMAKIVELAVDRAARNVLPSKTSDPDVLGEFAGWADTPRGDAVQTILNVTGTGVPLDVVGGGISGVTYVSGDGQKFYFENDLTIPASGIVDTQITAFLAGAQANLPKGTLDITAQNASISSQLQIKESDPYFREGQDAELFEAWRSNVNRGLQKPILSDNYSYFYQTTREVPGRQLVAGYAYVNRPGQVEVYVESNADDGVPTDDQMQDAQDWYDGTTDNVVRIPPHYDGVLPDDGSDRFQLKKSTQTAFQVRVTGMSPNTTAKQELVGQDIIDWFKERKPFIRGVNVQNRGVLDNKALTAIVQARVESGDITSFDSVAFSLTGTFNPITKYALGRGERSGVASSDIDWPAL